MARPKKSTARAAKPADRDGLRLYTLEVFLLSGPISEAFARKNRVVPHTIQIDPGRPDA